MPSISSQFSEINANNSDRFFSEKVPAEQFFALCFFFKNTIVTSEYAILHVVFFELCTRATTNNGSKWQLFNTFRCYSLLSIFGCCASTQTRFHFLHYYPKINAYIWIKRTTQSFYVFFFSSLQCWGKKPYFYLYNVALHIEFQIEPAVRLPIFARFTLNLDTQIKTLCAICITSDAFETKCILWMWIVNV